MNTEETWIAEVIADNSGQWVGNQLTFSSQGEAETYARDLSIRWTAVREWRVRKTDGAR